MKPTLAKLSAIVVITCAISLLTVFMAQAAPDLTWCDGMSDLLRGFQVSYPNSNLEPYFTKEASLRKATERGDEAALRAGITDAIKMRHTATIDEEAAVELVNYLYVWRSTLTRPAKYARAK